MKDLGLYLHIPFCRSKCLYCDFCSVPRPEPERMQLYVDALCRDLCRWEERVGDYRVETVYLGGGTPTVLPIADLARILSTVGECYHLAPDAEITIECNPATASREQLDALRRAGYNRLSMGVQSVHPEELKALGRLHRFADVLRTLEDARAAGFSNVSMDVMSGIPEQTEESWQATLEAVCKLSPEHISAYDLILEEGTPLHRAQAHFRLPGEESARRMYLSGVSYLSAQGYAQYEVSNFARPSYASRHNLRYWECREYLGLGVAAYSDLFGERFGNSRELDAYIAGEDITAERTCPSVGERLDEALMLGLRMSKGVSLGALEARFGCDAVGTLERALSPYLTAGLCVRMGDRIALTPEGMLVSNAILSELPDFTAIFQEKTEKIY